MENLKTGDLAFFESFSGLIACKVLKIVGTSGIVSTAQRVTVKITAHNKAWKHGEIIQAFALHVVPRKSVSWRRAYATIYKYTVTCD